MQIFRVSKNHAVSASYLDNRRLSKQVLELYQIIRVCLAQMDIIEGNTRYLNHPIVKHVYNDGRPYLIDALRMLKAMDQEHCNRNGKRSIAFKEDLLKLEDIILEQSALFSQEDLPAFYVYGDDKIYGDKVYEAYEKLLSLKWQQDKIAPRCNIHYKNEEEPI